MDAEPLQLILVEATPADWQLDPQTREIGRRGVADARRALATPNRRNAA